MQSTEKLDDTFQAESRSSMIRCTILKRIDVVFDLLDGDTQPSGPLSQHGWVMNSLCTTSNFLTTHEEIVRIRVVGISWGNHSVEGSSIDWIAVQHVEISVVLFLDETSKSLLSISAQIL